MFGNFKDDPRMEKQMLTSRVSAARSNLLLVIIFSLVNILLLAIYLVVLFIFFGANANTRAQIEYDKQERDAFYLLKEKAEHLLDKNPNRQVNKKK